MNKKHLLIITLCIFLAFSNSLLNDFSGDDYFLIVTNNFYRSWENFPRLFQKGYNFTNEQLLNPSDKGTGSVAYLPVFNLTYFIDFWLWQANPFGFHLQNLLIHFLNALLVYALIRRFHPPLALLGTLLFALHPVQSEAVCAIAYRAASLACLFTLISFNLWLKFTDTIKKGFSCFYYWGALAAYFLALFSKESAVMLPLILVIYEWFFLKKPGQKSFHLKRYYAGFVLVLAFYLFIYTAIFPNPTLKEFHWMGGTLLAHMAAMLKIWSAYMKAFLLPVTVHPLPGLYTPPVDPALDLGLAALFLLFIFLIFRFFHRARFVSFFLLWFLVFYIPVANIIPLPNPIAFRFVYLPSVGFLTALAFFIKKISEAPWVNKSSPRMGGILRNSVVGLCIACTIPLNAWWKDNYSMASSWIKHYPQHAKGYDLFAEGYMLAGDYKTAEKFLEKKLAAGLNGPLTYYWLGICSLEEQETEKAFDYFSQGIALYPDYADSYFGMGRLLQQKGQYHESIINLENAIRLSPGNEHFYAFLMQSYINLNQPQNARAVWARAKLFLDDSAVARLQKVLPQGQLP